MRREDFDEDIFEVGLLSKDCDVTGQTEIGGSIRFLGDEGLRGGQE